MGDRTLTPDPVRGVTTPGAPLRTRLQAARRAAESAPPGGEFYGQFGEDQILARFFSDAPAGFFVEVGAYDGIAMSNTLALERRGWRGILVEADPELAGRCRDNRPESVVVNCAATAPGGPSEVTFSVAVGCEGLSALTMDDDRLARVRHYTGSADIRRVVVPARCLDEILSEHGVTRIDVMTIDVEGHEWDVLRGTDLDRWKPTLLIVERNSTFLPPRMLRRLHRHGYRYRFSTGPNDWFLRDESAPAAGPGYWPWLLATQYGWVALRRARRAAGRLSQAFRRGRR